MERREFISAVSLGLLAAPLAAEAQPAAKLWRVGVVWTPARESVTRLNQALEVIEKVIVQTGEAKGPVQLVRRE